MTFDDVRKIGLKLPGATDTRYYRQPALKVGDEIFVVRTSHPSAEPNCVSIPVGFARRDKLIARNPETFYLTPHYEPYPVVVVRLDNIKRAELKELLITAHTAVSTGAVVPGQRKSATKKRR